MRFIGFYDYTVILTYMSLVSAVVGMYLSDQGMLTGAVLCLLFSGICDAFDGIVARTKKTAPTMRRPSASRSILFATR